MKTKNRIGAQVTRREFMASSLAGSASAVLLGGSIFRSLAEGGFPPPIVVFSKVYQELKLNFDEAAAVTAEAGLAGVDCPVRLGGEILPEHAKEELPRYAEVLEKRNLKLPLLTTGITSVSSPHAEDLLRTATKLGVQYYRLGFAQRQVGEGAAKQIQEIKAQLKDLAALNRQIGIGGIIQNHSPSGSAYVGGDLAEMQEIVHAFDPAQIGVAFDVGHALVVHGDQWLAQFERLKSHIRVVYVKDVTRAGRWVAFGQGDIGGLGYFKLVKQMGYTAPISLHIEYDWAGQGKAKTRAGLVKVLRENAQVLRRWLDEAR
jgi:sugar phosphate isomerase/epimerase